MLLTFFVRDLIDESTSVGVIMSLFIPSRDTDFNCIAIFSVYNSDYDYMGVAFNINCVVTNLYLKEMLS